MRRVCVEVGMGVVVRVVLLVVRLWVGMVCGVLVLVWIGVVGRQCLVLMRVRMHVVVRRLVLPGAHHLHHVSDGAHVPIRHGSRMVSQCSLQSHFGFRMHGLNLGRSTGVAKVWTLHAHDAGVH